MMEKLGMCGLISWLIGLVAAVIALILLAQKTERADFSRTPAPGAGAPPK